MKYHIKILFCATILFSVLNNLHAQNASNEKPQNLQVLPKDIDGEKLRQIMQGFTSALGVKCNYCHEESKTDAFGPMDFPSDGKKEKKIARTMIKMMNTINSDLLSVSRGIEPNIDEVSCITCHRGSAHIEMLEDVLFSTYKRNGLDASFNKYNELKKRYYAGFTYDFRDHTLLSFASKVSEEGNADDALKIILKNCELFPESSISYSFLGNYYVKQNDKEKAVESFEKALSLDPNNRFATQQLKKLKSTDRQ